MWYSGLAVKEKWKGLEEHIIILQSKTSSLFVSILVHHMYVSHVYIKHARIPAHMLHLHYSSLI